MIRWTKKQGKTILKPKKVLDKQSCAVSRSDRGFKIIVDREAEKVLISLNASAIANKHKTWRNCVKKNAGLLKLDPQASLRFSRFVL